MIKKRLSLLAAAMFVMIIATAPAQALNESSTTLRPNEAVTNAADKSTATTRKQLCQNRQRAINQIMTQHSQALQTRLRTFDKISQRIQDYYTNNKLSSADYERLAAQVEAKQQAAVQAMETFRNSEGIDCTAEDPLANVKQFKTRAREAQAAMKEYRAAIRAMLGAVIAAAKEAA